MAIKQRSQVSSQSENTQKETEKGRTLLTQQHTHAHTCINAPGTDSNATASSTACHLPQGKQSPSCSRASLHQPSFTFESAIPTCGMKGGVSQVK